MFKAKERASAEAGAPPWVRHEHAQRYAFASRFVEGVVVVDVACGSGAGTAVYSAAAARRIHAFDLSPEAVESTSDRALPDVRAEIADGRAMPLADASADVVVTLETIEHVPDHERFVDEIARVLRPGGAIVCSTPNRTVYSPGVGRDGKPWNPYHVKEFDLEEIRGSLERHFTDLELFGQNPSNPLVARFLDRLGRTLPFYLAVRMRQAAKLRMFLHDTPERHAVQPLDHSRPPEIFVIVGSRRSG